MRRTLSVIVAALLGVLAAAPPAGAAVVDGEVPWPGWPICAEGTLGLDEYTATGTRITGQIQPCAGTDPASGHFGLATYFDSGAYIAQTGIKAFPADGSPVSGLSREFRPGQLTSATLGPIRAVCLVVYPKVKIACVRLVELDGVVWASPLPTDDPAVRLGVTVLKVSIPNPECAGCV